MSVKFWVLASFLLLIASPAAAAESVATLADDYVAIQMDAQPVMSDLTGLPGRHDLLPDISPAGIARYDSREAELWAKVSQLDSTSVPPRQRATYAVLKEALADDIGMQACRSELWSVNHMFGWQAVFAQAAAAQAVDTPKGRADALARWAQVPAYLRQDEANLREGLRLGYSSPKLGYSSPKTVVRRVLIQLDELLAPPADASRLASPGLRSDDPAFRAAFVQLVDQAVNPAIRAYRAFLVDTYLPAARDELGVSALPNGQACYAASLRMFTTLPRTPAQVKALGESVVKQNKADVAALGLARFQTADLPTIYQRVNAAPDNSFASADEFLAYSRAHLARNIAATRPVFADYPRQEVVIDPLPVDIKAIIPPHYEPQPDLTGPGRFVLPLAVWPTTHRGEAEILSVHEAVPGHHLQLSSMFERQEATQISKLVVNAAYSEGWARYAENLAEELGLYETDYAKIGRRAWQAHGMVLDPGIHVFGWSRDEGIAYLKATGRFNDDEAAAMLDRIAMVPGQLTAYDTGGLEFLALRREAKAALGDRFDLRRFHTAVLEEGAVPLIELRAHVSAWIAAEKARK